MIKRSIVLPNVLVGVDICWVKLKVFNTLINLETWKSSGSLKCKLKSHIIKKKNRQRNNIFNLIIKILNKTSAEPLGEW